MFLHSRSKQEVYRGEPKQWPLFLILGIVVGVLTAFVLAICMSSCAGKVPGTPAWTQPAENSWDYGFPTGALLGRVVLIDDTFSSYGCNGQNKTGFASLAAAEQFVESSCANVNQK